MNKISLIVGVIITFIILSVFFLKDGFGSVFGKKEIILSAASENVKKQNNVSTNLPKEGNSNNMKEKNKSETRKTHIEDELAGIKLGDSLETVQLKLGKPMTIKDEGEEKDLKFDGITISFLNDIVTKIYIEKIGFKTKKGLVVGIPDERNSNILEELYGEPDFWVEKGNAESGKSEGYYRCTNHEFVVETTEEGIVIAVWIETI